MISSSQAAASLPGVLNTTLRFDFRCEFVRKPLMLLAAVGLLGPSRSGTDLVLTVIQLRRILTTD
jgi:hypothetical protein